MEGGKLGGNGLWDPQDVWTGGCREDGQGLQMMDKTRELDLEGNSEWWGSSVSLLFFCSAELVCS